MAKNSFFNTTTSQREQKMISDLISESIQIMGENVVYLPQSLVAVDDFFLEDALTKYSESFLIEMYRDVEDYGTVNVDFFGKFGITQKDKTKFIVSKSTFDRLVSYNNLTVNRPLETDLIYDIATSSLFKITHVEHESPYRMLGAVQTYMLNAEIFKYSHQRVTPEDYNIDKQVNQFSTEIKIYLTALPATDFIINELVVSGGTTAKVTDYNAVELSLTVIDRNGTFKENAAITGQSSGTTGVIRKFKTSNDSNQVLDINELLQNKATTLINDKNSNITGTIVTTDFMSGFF